MQGQCQLKIPAKTRTATLGSEQKLHTGLAGLRRLCRCEPQLSDAGKLPVANATAAPEFSASPKTVSHRRQFTRQSGKCSRRGQRRLCPSIPSKLFGRRERQAAFALEKSFQPPVAGTALAPDDAGRDHLAALAAKPPALQPIFPTDSTLNRDWNAGGF